VAAAIAQRPAGAPAGRLQAASGQLDRATRLQAETVARELDLSEELRGKLVAAYQEARRAHQASTREQLREAVTGGDRRGAAREMLQLNPEHRQKLEAALKGFLTEEQATRALASLGSFDRQWDRMVIALADLGLAEEKLEVGLSHLNAYAAAADQGRRSAAGAGDLRGFRSAAQEARSKLEGELAQLLTEEQLKKWKDETAAPMGRGAESGPRRRAQP